MSEAANDRGSSDSGATELPPALIPRPAELDLSAVITCYFEEQSIDEFHTRLSATLESIGRPYEIIFINDGSTDATWDRLRSIFERDPRVSAAIDLFRNTGQTNAATPGMMLARGRGILLIDSDLQLEPEELPKLLAAFDAGADIVSGYRVDRKDSSSRQLPSLLANIIMRRASGSEIRDFGCTYKIYDARLVKSFEFGPFKPWLPVPVIAAASRITEVPVRHHPRRYGQSGWTFRKLFAYNMESVVSLSDKFFQYLGATCLLLSLVFLVRIASTFVVDSSILEVTEGLVLNAVVLSLLVTTAILSAIGEFVIRNFVVLQRKPAFVVREILRRSPTQRAVEDRSVERDL